MNPQDIWMMCILSAVIIILGMVVTATLISECRDARERKERREHDKKDLR